MGIDILKKAVKVAIDFGEALDKKLADGKLTFIEAFQLIPDLRELPWAISNASIIKDELLDLTDLEKAELVQYIKDELDLENDKVESIIENAISALLALSVLAGSVKSK